MRRIPDIIIAVGVIVGATSIATGYRWVGVISLLVAMVVGWKRDWCIESFDGLISSSESSAGNRLRQSDADVVADGGHSSDSGGGDAGSGDLD